MNILVDTCVIIDALQQREPFAESAQALCLAIARGQVDGFIPAKSVADIYYIMHRSLHDDAQVRSLLKKLLMSFGILDTTALDCRSALSSPVSDFGAAILAETAHRSGIDCIVTRNLRDFSRSAIPALPPDELLASLEKKTAE